MGNLIGKKVNSYMSSKSGKPVKTYVFALTGSKEDLAAYKAAKVAQNPEYYVEDKDGKPLYWSTNSKYELTDTALVTVTINGNVADTQSEIDVIASVVDKYASSPFGMALAQEGAKRVLAGLDRQVGSARATSSGANANANANTGNSKSDEKLD